MSHGWWARLYSFFFQYEKQPYLGYINKNVFDFCEPKRNSIKATL